MQQRSAASGAPAAPGTVHIPGSSFPCLPSYLLYKHMFLFFAKKQNTVPPLTAQQAARALCSRSHVTAGSPAPGSHALSRHPAFVHISRIPKRQLNRFCMQTDDTPTKRPQTGTSPAPCTAGVLSVKLCCTAKTAGTYVPHPKQKPPQPRPWIAPHSIRMTSRVEM